MKPFQERVVEERISLGEKVQKLFHFFDTEEWDRLSPHAQTLLEEQYQAMKSYYEILCKRIKLFKEEE